MQIELEGIDSRSIVIALPAGGPDGNAAQQVTVRELVRLRGKLRKEADGVRLSDVTSELAVVEVLKLWFGTVLLASDEVAALRGVATSLDPKPGSVHFDLEVESLSAHRLRLEVAAGVAIGAITHLEQLQLQVRGEEGRLKAKSARLKSFSLRLGAITLQAPDLIAADLLVAWGGGAFHLRAQAVEAGELVVTAPGAELRISGLSAQACDLDNGDVAVTELRVERATLALDTSAMPAASVDTTAAATAAKPRALPLFDLLLLDGLSGHLHADLDLATTLPVMQRRRATHALRIAIDRGSIDYRALESGLSRLEDALLDFSLRGDTLVLEIGVPLLPTRGLGKPLITWPLTEPEIELARAQRILLSTLLSVTSQKDASEQDGQASTSPIELIEFDLQLLEAALALTQPTAPLPAVVQSLALGSLRLGGCLRHHRSDEETRTGQLEAQFEQLGLELRALPLQDKRLDLEALRVGRLVSGQIAFEDLQPQRVSAELHAISIARATLTK